MDRKRALTAKKLEEIARKINSKKNIHWSTSRSSFIPSKSVPTAHVTPTLYHNVRIVLKQKWQKNPLLPNQEFKAFPTRSNSLKAPFTISNNRKIQHCSLDRSRNDDPNCRFQK
ncbi:unnamed protein product [Acanthoscelides obtectus]|uniref:Uncharacterized protein n=1 Tax=Acanthoscelides obtectus TaxID=200917 RepID=A0A9P0P200_ACAOB|nr:unnamed protein product [Acanthoscelides obtectus]CAK1623789.1 hypothetical protein AOBTE_LOCUS2183 [Acanthoscelides obtectus]